MGMPTTSVLRRMPDPRARQYWDARRLLSRVMARDLPADTLASLAERDSLGVPVVWDCVALFRPGVRWEKKFPVPDWSGRPVVDVASAFREQLAKEEASTSGSAR